MGLAASGMADVVGVEPTPRLVDLALNRSLENQARSSVSYTSKLSVPASRIAAGKSRFNRLTRPLNW
jgi:hypothetical protein